MVSQRHPLGPSWSAARLLAKERNRPSAGDTLTTVQSADVGGVHPTPSEPLRGAWRRVPSPPNGASRMECIQAPGTPESRRDKNDRSDQKKNKCLEPAVQVWAPHRFVSQSSDGGAAGGQAKAHTGCGLPARRSRPESPERLDDEQAAQQAEYHRNGARRCLRHRLLRSRFFPFRGGGTTCPTAAQSASLPSGSVRRTCPTSQPAAANKPTAATEIRGSGRPPYRVERCRPSR